MDLHRFSIGIPLMGIDFPSLGIHENGREDHGNRFPSMGIHGSSTREDSLFDSHFLINCERISFDLTFFTNFRTFHSQLPTIKDQSSTQRCRIVYPNFTGPLNRGDFADSRRLHLENPFDEQKLPIDQISAIHSSFLREQCRQRRLTYSTYLFKRFSFLFHLTSFVQHFFYIFTFFLHCDMTVSLLSVIKVQTKGLQREINFRALSINSFLFELQPSS